MDPDEKMHVGLHDADIEEIGSLLPTDYREVLGEELGPACVNQPPSIPGGPRDVDEKTIPHDPA
jgi:hypothetical protein